LLQIGDQLANLARHTEDIARRRSACQRQLLANAAPSWSAAGERTRLACSVRCPRRTHGPVGGAPAGAAEAAALPAL